MKKVDEQTAELDYDKFVKALKIRPKNLEKFAKVDEETDTSPKQSFIDLIMEGALVVNEDGTATYTLFNPIGDNDEIKEFSFMTRKLTLNEVERVTGKTDIESAKNLLKTLTGANIGIIGNLDSDDFTEMSNVAAFFLPR